MAEAKAVSHRNTPSLPPARWRLTQAFIGVFARMTMRHKLHTLEHVGAFAGSLLQHGDWDHK